MLLLNLRYVVWCRDPFLSRQCQYPPPVPPPTANRISLSSTSVFVERCVGSTVVLVLGIYLYTCTSPPVNRCVIFECQGTLKHTTHRDGEGPQEPYWIFQYSSIVSVWLEPWKGDLTLKKTPFRTVLGKMDRCSIALCSILEWFRLPSCLGRQQIVMWCFPW